MNSTKRESNTALYAVSEYAEFSSLLALAKAVRAELGLHPVFVFKHDYGALELHAKQLDALHFSWASAKQASLHTNYSASGDEDDYVPTYVRLPKVASSVRERSRTAATLRWAATIGGIAATPIVVLGAIPALFFRGARTRSLLPMLKRLGRMHPGIVKMRYQKLLAEMRKVFDLFRPSIVISGQDYSLSITAMASLVAEERGIRTAIVPFSMTPTTKELAESFSGTRTNLLRGRLRSNLIRKVFPQWINHSLQKKCVWRHQYRGCRTAGVGYFCFQGNSPCSIALQPAFLLVSCVPQVRNGVTSSGASRPQEVGAGPTS
jgi:hypothetical protein